MSDFDFDPTADLAIDDEFEAALEDAEDVDLEARLPLGRGYVFDYTAGEFVTYGSEPKDAIGLANVQVWIEKALRTARFAHPIYSDNFGIDVVELIGQPVTPELLSQYALAVEDALLAHDRITAVTDFTFNYDASDEVLEVGFTVVLDEGEDTLVVDPVPVGESL